MTTALTTALGILDDVLSILVGTNSGGAEAGCVLQPLPCRAGLAPGAEVAWDSCGESGCDPEAGLDGQLWANLASVTPLTSTGAASGRCGSYAWQAEIGIVRCAATLHEDGSPPSADEVAADAWQQAADADAIHAALFYCHSRTEAIKDLGILSWNPVGPSGGCVGGIWAVRGTLDVCC